MAAHRYWRLYITKREQGSVGSALIWLQEVSFRSADGVDLSVGGAAISGGDSSPYFKEKAFDKIVSTDPSSGWGSSAVPGWIGYDHGVPVDVAFCRVSTQVYGAQYGQWPVNFGCELEWSDNGVDWNSDPGVTLPFAGGVWGFNQVLDIKKMFPGVMSHVSSPFKVLGYNLEPQSPHSRLWAKGGTWRWETQTTGSGTISGTVTIENIPGSRKVRLYRKHDGMLLRETWSAANGAYSFTNIDPAWEYFVVAHDHLRVYNGVIQDMLVP